MKSTLKNESTPGGRTFKVTITETYQRTVTIYESCLLYTSDAADEL